VGFGCGWVKLNVLQKRWLVCWLAALLILRSVGILSTVFLSVYVVSSATLAPNVLGLCVGGLLKPKTFCQHQRLLIA